MGLEIATYITGLTPSWPPSGDPKNQGDDHIRLLKSVLQATFPNASQAFYFPSATTGSLGSPVLASDWGKTLIFTNSGSDSLVSLPSSAGLSAGWWCEIVKASTDGSAIVISAASGTITTQFGSVATVRVGTPMLPVRFMWEEQGGMPSAPGR